MEGLFALLVFTSFIFLMIGIFNPQRSLFWDRTGPTRRKSMTVYGCLTILFFILFCTSSEKKEPIAAERKLESTSTAEPNEIVKKVDVEDEATLFDHPNRLISMLSENGIGDLKPWENPFDMGWGSITDYYPFGPQKDGVGMQNNIAYYVEGTETKATKLYINLNINNPADKENALKFLREVSERTFKTLNISMPGELANAILRSKRYKTKVKDYVVSNELERSKIETWKVNIEKVN